MTLQKDWKWRVDREGLELEVEFDRMCCFDFVSFVQVHSQKSVLYLFRTRGKASSFITRYIVTISIKSSKLNPNPAALLCCLDHTIYSSAWSSPLRVEFKNRTNASPI